jgi:hypothetical protein
MCSTGAKKALAEDGDDVEESPLKKVKKEESASEADAPGDVVTP